MVGPEAEVSTFFSAAGLLATTTAVTQWAKRALPRVPVPVLAFLIGEALALSVWQAGYLNALGIQPAGATPFEWVIVVFWIVTTVVLGAMGASTVWEQPRAIVQRGTQPKQ